MTNIEEIRKLYAKSGTYKIPREPKEGEQQAEINIVQLDLNDSNLLEISENMPPDKQAAAAKKLIAKSIGIKEEEVGPIAMRFLEELMEDIMAVNNISDQDQKKMGIKSFLEQKRAQIEEEKKKHGQQQPPGPT